MFPALLAIGAAIASLVTASSQSRNPLQFLGIVEDPRINTHRHRIGAHSSFELRLNLYEGQRQISLALEPNHDILGEGATLTHLDQHGAILHQAPFVRADHKVYMGVARMRAEDGSWERVGDGRIHILKDGLYPLFEGVFTVNHDHHHIQMSTSYMSNKHALDPVLESADDEAYMVVWRDSDIAPNSAFPDLRRDVDTDLTCQADQLQFNKRIVPRSNILKREQSSYWGTMPIGNMFGKRQTEIDTQPGLGNSGGVNLADAIGQSAGCPDTRKVALVGVATDCTYSRTFNDTGSATANIITQINSASSLWESSFNISLGLQNVTVMPESCPGSPPAATPWNQNCDADLDIQDRLNLFSAWRGTLIDGNSHWTLLTNCNTGSAVGLAWLGQACTHGSQADNTTGQGETVSGANIVAKTPTEWQVISHETGHTYGAVHDCTSQSCADPDVVNSQQCCPLSSGTCDAGEQYIMNPFTTAGITKFSPCSIGNVCSGIGRNQINTTCLSANKGVVTISGQQCGNGIVEAGEDCDCGGEAGCGDDPCCEPKTCKFKGSAVCDDANEDCCTNCQFTAAGQVCRSSTGTCDPEEICSGSNAVCPDDVNAPNGQSCSLNTSVPNAGALACASGQCTSRDLQCRSVMGAYIQGNNDTYACDQNTCTMSCASPSFGPGVCYGLQQNLLDGSPCGGGGNCNNGRCQGSSTAKEVGNWISNHKPLVFGIVGAVGGILLLAILSCMCSCFKRRRNRPPKPGSSPAESWYGPPPPVHGARQMSTPPISPQQAHYPPPQQAHYPPPQQAYYPPPMPPQAQYDGTWGDQPGWRPPMPPTQLQGNGIIGNRGGSRAASHQPPYWPHETMRYA